MLRVKGMAKCWTCRVDVADIFFSVQLLGMAVEGLVEQELVSAIHLFAMPRSLLGEITRMHVEMPLDAGRKSGVGLPCFALEWDWTYMSWTQVLDCRTCELGVALDVGHIELVISAIVMAFEAALLQSPRVDGYRGLPSGVNGWRL